MVVGPEVAELLAVNVSALVLVVVAGLNAAVTPLGNPEAVRATLPVNPPLGLTVIVAGELLLPCVTLNDPGAADKLKFCGGFTVRLMLVVCTVLPDVPVTVIVAGPVVAELLAVNVSVLVLVVVAGLNAAVSPLGNPEAVKVTLPVNPPVGLTVIVVGEPLLPCVTLNDPGAADKLKFGPPVTTVSANFTGARPVVVAVIVTAPGLAGVLYEVVASPKLSVSTVTGEKLPPAPPSL
jgi:hypothetical protein